MPESVVLKPGLFQSMAMGGTAAAFAVNFTVRELEFYLLVPVQVGQLNTEIY